MLSLKESAKVDTDEAVACFSEKVVEDPSGSSNTDGRPYTAEIESSTTKYSIAYLYGFVKHQPNSQNNGDSIYCIENHTERNRYDTLYGKKRRFDL